MTSQTRLLVGSLSNDMFRVANLRQRGSTVAAKRFLVEAKRWASELQHQEVAGYIRKITEDVVNKESGDISEAEAERYLMYGVLLQNYTLKVGD